MINNLLLDVISISVAAGRAIMSIYSDPDNEIISKSDNSPLTQADLASDRIISTGLIDLGLGWPILSEESAQIDYEKRKNWTRFWLVDPLDGTKEFIKRNGEFTVNIALIENGNPILGVVYAPALDTCYFAERGAGAFVRHGTEEPESIQATPYMQGETVKIVASRSHQDVRTEAFINKLGDCQCIGMGSSLKLCLVAEGTAHLYPRLGPTMEWDTAAAHAVVKEASGRVCDVAGIELQYNKPDLHNPEFFVLHAADQFLFESIVKC